MKIWLFVVILLVSLYELVNGKLVNQNAYIGQNIQIKCLPEGIAPQAIGIKYRWEKPIGTVIGNSQTLKIKAIQIRNSGIYTCFAMYESNGEQKESFASTNIYIQDPDGKPGTSQLQNPPKILFNTQDVDTIYVEKGKFVYSICSVVNWPKDDYEVYWEEYPDTNQKSPMKYIYPVNENMQVTCVANHKKTKEVLRRTLNIRIDKKRVDNIPGNSNIQVSILVSPSSPIHKDDFLLTCQLNPKVSGASFKWMKDGREIGRGEKFLVQNFVKEDRGKYSCSATLPPGYKASQNTAVFKVDYRRTEKPVMSLQPNGVQIVSDEGEVRELHCEVEKRALYRGKDAKWFFNGRPLTPYELSQGNMKLMNRYYVSILKLQSISTRNEGEYTCRIGNDVVKGYLIVREKSKELSIEPKVLDINENQVAEFHCQLFNLPTNYANTMIWSYEPSDQAKQLGATSVRDAQTLGFSINRSDMRSVFLTKRNVKPKDDGFYTCTVPNGMSKRAQLRVQPAVKLQARITISPKQTVTKPNNQILIECSTDQFSTANVQLGFRIRGTFRPINDPRFSERMIDRSRIRLTISPGLNFQESGMEIECYNKIGRETDVAKITVMNACLPGERKCLSGQCLPEKMFCNGYRDCIDGSDEEPAVCNRCKPLIKKCEYNKRRPPTKSNFQIHWRCDGEDDCGNNFDEEGCTFEEEKCSKRIFRCFDGMTIPRAYQCDKDSDCRNNEDELDCTAPSFVRNFQGQDMKRARIGDTVTFTCTAMGKPLPTIVWRWNWGCLRDKTRMTTTSLSSRDCKQQTSTLTIRNFQREDSGIYNCEGLSGNQRVFSEDYRLVSY